VFRTFHCSVNFYALLLEEVKYFLWLTFTCLPFLLKIFLQHNLTLFKSPSPLKGEGLACLPVGRDEVDLKTIW